MASDRPVVVATPGAVVSLLQAGNTAGFLFEGLAYVASGLALSRREVNVSRRPAAVNHGVTLSLPNVTRRSLGATSSTHAR